MYKIESFYTFIFIAFYNNALLFLFYNNKGRGFPSKSNISHTNLNPKPRAGLHTNNLLSLI